VCRPAVGIEAQPSKNSEAAAPTGNSTADQVPTNDPTKQDLDRVASITNSAPQPSH
jgi:hypothetical protein